MGTQRSALSADGKSWNPLPGHFYFGGGGGTSEDFAQPWYQSWLVPSSLSHTLMTGAKSSSAMRVTPDVAMNGDLYTAVLVGMTSDGTYSEGGYGGTSVASPEFAAVQADAIQGQHHAIGFANPEIYVRGTLGPVQGRRRQGRGQGPGPAEQRRRLRRHQRHAGGPSGLLRRRHLAQRHQGLRQRHRRRLAGRELPAVLQVGATARLRGPAGTAGPLSRAVLTARRRGGHWPGASPSRRRTSRSTAGCRTPRLGHRRMAWASIDTDGTGDSVWVDRSWDGGTDVGRTTGPRRASPRRGPAPAPSCTTSTTRSATGAACCGPAAT